MASAVSSMSFSTDSRDISLFISFNTAAPCCNPNITSFSTKANSIDRVWHQNYHSVVCTKCSNVSSCWSAFSSTCSWYFLLRRMRRAFCFSPRTSASFASSLSRFRTVCTRFEYWWSLSRWILRSNTARSGSQHRPEKRMGGHFEVLPCDGLPVWIVVPCEVTFLDWVAPI